MYTKILQKVGEIAFPFTHTNIHPHTKRTLNQKKLIGTYLTPIMNSINLAYLNNSIQAVFSCLIINISHSEGTLQ